MLKFSSGIFTILYLVTENIHRCKERSHSLLLSDYIIFDINSKIKILFWTYKMLLILLIIAVTLIIAMYL
jgi:hypothetical protein